MKKEKGPNDQVSTQSHIMTGIRFLMASGRSDNIMLALQILEGNGVPDELLTHVFVVKTWHDDAQLRNKAEQLFKKHAPDELIKHIKTHWKAEFTQEHNEVKISEQLDRLANFKGIDKEVLGMGCLKLSKKGGKFCLEHDLAPKEFILQELVSGRELYLANFELLQLPKEVGLFPQLAVLNISGNKFSEVPQEISNLNNLESLYFARTPLSAATIRYLEKIFPKIFALKYFNEACDLQSDEQFFKAAFLFTKAAHLAPNFAEAWLNIGSSYIFAGKKVGARPVLLRAIDEYNLRIKANQNSAYDWFGKSLAFTLLEDKTKALSALGKAIFLNKDYKLHVRHEEIFEVYREDKEFKRLIQ